jgi:hypothetical protein
VDFHAQDAYGSEGSRFNSVRMRHLQVFKIILYRPLYHFKPGIIENILNSIWLSPNVLQHLLRLCIDRMSAV